MSTIPVDRLQQSVAQQAHQDFAWVSVDHTVGEALAHVQSSRVSERVVYFYVLDAQQRPVGVVPARGLLLNPAPTPIKEIMLRQVVTLPASATLMDACEMFMLHRLLALPVVDEQGRMTGVLDVSVYTDEIIDLADREMADDVFQMIGVRMAQVRQASPLTVFRWRFPWLLCNITGGILCALLAGIYRDVLEQVIALALFMPVVLALAESVSMQSLTLTLQRQHRGRVEWKSELGSILREIPVGILLGLAAGTLVALVAWIWLRQPILSLSMLASLALSVTSAALIGRLVPVFLGSAQRDPKVASGPIALALSDVATMFYFLAFAAWWVGR